MDGSDAIFYLKGRDEADAVKSTSRQITTPSGMKVLTVQFDDFSLFNFFLKTSLKSDASKIVKILTRGMNTHEKV